MIQDIVARLAGYSATVKNFCITVVAGAVLAALAANDRTLFWIAFVAAILFAALDAYYLRLERAFRASYGEVAGRPLSEAENLAIKKGKQVGGELYLARRSGHFTYPDSLWLGG